MAYCECGDLGRAVDIGEQALADLGRGRAAGRGERRGGAARDRCGLLPRAWRPHRAQLLIDRPWQGPARTGTSGARGSGVERRGHRATVRHDSVGRARARRPRAGAVRRARQRARGGAPAGRVGRLCGCVSRAAGRPGRRCASSSRAMDDLHEVGTRLDCRLRAHRAGAGLLITGRARTVGRDRPRQALDDLSSGDRLLTGCGDAGPRTRRQGPGRLRARAITVLPGGGDRTGGTGPRPVRPGPPGASSARPTSSWAASRRRIEALRRASDFAGATYNPLRPASVAAATAGDRSLTGPLDSATSARDSSGRAAIRGPDPGRVNVLTGG